MAWNAAAVLLAVAGSAASVPAHGLDQDTPPGVVYTPLTPGTQTAWREHDGSVWSSAEITATLSGGGVFHELANCPVRDELALLSLADDRTLTLQVNAAGLWGSASVVASDTGLSTSKAFACAYEQVSGEVLTVYRTNAASSGVAYRAGSGGAQQWFEMSLSSAPTWVALMPRPRSDDVVMIAVSSGRLYSAVWNGTAWGNQVTLESALPTSGRPYGLAGLTQSGQVLAVWGGNVGSPRYRTWDGTVWSAAQSLSMAGGATRWLSLAANPASSSNEAILTTIDTNNDISLVRWDGAAWSGASTVETNASANTSQVVDVAYQPDGARAVVAWHADGEDRLKYRVWNGSSWSGTGVTADFASRPMSVHLSPARSPDSITMGVRRQGVASYNDYVMYSDSGSVSEGSATVIGAVGQNEPGVDLPAAPSGNANSSHVNVGNNASRTLTPGTYGRLETGNSSIVNFSGAGTYIFELFKANNNTATFNFATGGGDIVLVFTNGKFDAKNNVTMNTTGGGSVEIHVRAGDFEIQNNANLNSPQIYVYSGNIQMGTNTQFTGAMYASGNINVGSGSVTLGTGVSTGPGRLSVMVWESGVAGPATDLASALHGTGQVQPFAFTSAPLPRGLSVSRWREVGADE